MHLCDGCSGKLTTAEVEFGKNLCGSCISESEGFYPEILKKKQCCICGIKLDGWVYYEKNGIKICRFCYKDLELKGEE